MKNHIQIKDFWIGPQSHRRIEGMEPGQLLGGDIAPDFFFFFKWCSKGVEN